MASLLLFKVIQPCRRNMIGRCECVAYPFMILH